MKRSLSSLRTLLEEQVHAKRHIVQSLREENKPIGEVTVDQVAKGMRGMRFLFTETSKVDPQKGIRFRGLSIDDCMHTLPTKATVPLPESIFWLLLTGEVPSASQTEDLRAELEARATLPLHTVSLINALSPDLHPMTQLSMGVLSLSQTSHLKVALSQGLPKVDYWKPALEDGLDLVAKSTSLAALIYANTYRKGNLGHSVPNADWTEAFARQLGYSDTTFFELLRLYLTLHCDHDGGNVSAHSTHIVGSSLADLFKAYSAGLNGLAGPLHGRANQEVLKFLLSMAEAIGQSPTICEIQQFVRQEYLKKGKVVPGYGHATLKVTDARFLAQQEFSLKFVKESWICKLVHKCYEAIPSVLQEHGRSSNPYPNVDAHSGALLYALGFTDYEFFTCFFGVSRTIGCAAQHVWEKALLLPIERPKSMTMEELAKV